MQRHELKCWPQYFQPTMQGEKRFEIRYNDRDYAVGDELFLREWDPITREYTGHERVCEVEYILKVFLPGLNPNFIIMSIKLQEAVGLTKLQKCLNAVAYLVAEAAAVNGDMEGIVPGDDPVLDLLCEALDILTTTGCKATVAALDLWNQEQKETNI